MGLEGQLVLIRSVHMPRGLVALWFLITILLVSGGARAQVATWTVLPMTAVGVDPVAAATFRDVLEGELMAASGTTFVPAPSPCRDVPCARGAGAYTGASVVVFGLMRPLGAKIVVQVTMVDGRSGRVLAVANENAQGIEQLDTAAKLVAASLLARSTPNGSPGATHGSSPPEATPSAYGSPSPVVPEDEVDDDPSGLRAGYMMRVGGFQPLDDTYGGLGMGMLFDMGAWIEGDAFAMEPRLGVRFDTSLRDDSAYFALPMDFGAFFAPQLGDIRPFIGGGLGFRYVWEKRGRHVEIGNAVITEHDGVLKKSGTGLGAFGRAGMVLLDSHRVHLVLSAEYDLTFIELTTDSSPKAFAFGLAVVL